MLSDDILTIFNHILATTHFVCSGLLECQLSGKRSAFLMDHQWLEGILQVLSHCLFEVHLHELIVPNFTEENISAPEV